jgi:hypothetical protein
MLYKLELAGCQSKIRSWEKTWLHNDFDEEAYRYLWGENYSNITEGRESVRALSLQIGGSVKRRHEDDEVLEDEEFLEDEDDLGDDEDLAVHENPEPIADGHDWYLWRKIAFKLRKKPNERPKFHDAHMLERIIFTFSRIRSSQRE